MKRPQRPAGTAVWRRFVWAALLVIGACSPQPEQPRSRWKVIGPGGGGSQHHPAISPHDSRRVLIGCDMTGSYISHDGGESWRMFNLGSPARFFVFDPVDPNIIYAGTRGLLWRSVDAGEKWKLVCPHPATLTGAVMRDDHAHQELITTGKPAGVVSALAVDPDDSNTLFAAIQEARPQGAGYHGSSLRARQEAEFTRETHLYISTDQGETWRRSHRFQSGARRIYVDPRSPREDRTLYVPGKNSVAVRQGGRWRRGRTPPGVDLFQDITMGFPPDGGKPIVYAVTETAIFVSADGGATWRASSFPGQSARFKAVAAALRHPDVAYISYAGLQLGDGLQRPYLGVAESTDRGGAWELVWKESARLTGANLRNGWTQELFGPTAGSNPFHLAVASDDPNVCYGGDYFRTMRTTDGGETWKQAYTSRREDGSWTSTGLDVTTNYGVHFDPFDANRMLISYTDIGLFRSENGGRSWISATGSVPRPWSNTTYWIEFDPEVKGRVWAVMSGVHDLPRPKMWLRRAVETFTGGVWMSDDSARTWRRFSEGMPETAATHILLDPTSPVEARVLYVTGFGRGVYKSTDGGKSWTLHNDGIEGDEPFAWRLVRDARGVLYLVVARRSNDGSIGNEQDGALYRSADGAGHWTRVALPEGVNGPNGLAVDPADPQRLYLAAWGRRTPEHALGGGIFLSTDGGASWRTVLSEDQHVYDVTIDPKDPNILYACGFGSSAWRSTDHGETWQRIPGYNFKWGHRVIPDPYHPEMIYITTFGGSVWHGPAVGDPRAVEDIVTPALAYGR